MPFYGSLPAQKQWMDTTILFVSQFLYYDVLKLTGNNPFTHINEIDSANCPLTGIYSVAVKAAKIYPNPSKHSAYIELRNGQSSIELINLQDITGRTVLVQVGNHSNQMELNLSNLNSGIYTLKCKSEPSELVSIDSTDVCISNPTLIEQ